MKCTISFKLELLVPVFGSCEFLFEERQLISHLPDGFQLLFQLLGFLFFLRRELLLELLELFHSQKVFFNPFLKDRQLMLIQLLHRQVLDVGFKILYPFEFVIAFSDDLSYAPICRTDSISA